MNRPAASLFRFGGSSIMVCLLLALAALAIYFPVCNYGFVSYDDSDYFFANPHVLGGLTWANIRWAFTSGEYANWHPLTWLSLMLDATLFGKGAAAPHFTNVLLHAANSILIFLLFRELTGAFWRSAVLAMLFAIHPLHVESVAWIAERKDVLSTFFGLLALLCYARYAANDRERRVQTTSLGVPNISLFYWLALFFFTCGLMSKPMLVTLPFVMLLLDFWPLERFKASSFHGLFIEKIPFILLTVASSIVTFIVQHKQGAVIPLEVLPLGVRVENAFVSYARYLGKVFCPVRLAVIYPYHGYWPIFTVILSIAFFVALCGSAAMLRKKFPWSFTGWFWFAGMLVPVIGLVQVGEQSLADRYMYLPLVGILVILVWGAAEIRARWRLPGSVIIFLLAILFLACGVRARNQVRVWQDDGTLFGNALAVTKGNYVAELDMGFWYSKNGQPAKALKYYYGAYKMSPNDPSALYNIGNAFGKLGHWDEATHLYQRALQITPDQPDILDNLGFALAQTKRLPEAAQCFEASLKLKPKNFSALNNLATIFFIQGRYADAKQQYLMALELDPNNVRLLIYLGDTCVHLNDKIAAWEFYQHALQLDPNDQNIRARLQALGPQNPD